MPQINLRTTDQFERDLFAVMSSLRMPTKTAAIRFAIHEVAEALRGRPEREPAPQVNAGNGASR